MEKKFKGMPWPWHSYRSRFDELCVGTPDGDTICEVLQYENEENETEANARLIAAAPEMLEALQNCQIWLDATYRALKNNHIDGNYEPLREVADEAEAVITKALGLEQILIV